MNGPVQENQTSPIEPNNMSMTGPSKCFTDWIMSKQSNIRDFQSLSLLDSALRWDQFTAITEAFFELKPSFSQGQKAIELFVDIILLERTSKIRTVDLSTPFDRAVNIENCLEMLTEVRNPQSTASDRDRKKQLESLKWPVGAKIKSERRADRFGVEIKIFISSRSDLTKLIATLERVKDEFPE